MKKAVGIDIGSYSIKLIELETKKTHFELTKCASNRIIDGDVKSALKDMLSLAKLSLRRVNVSLSGPSVIVRYVEMPPMKKEELKSAVRFEAEKYIPFNIDDSIVDCAMLGKTNTGSRRVLLVAAKKNEVDSLLGLFKEVGLEINIIDVDSFALLNSFQRIKNKDKEDDAYALINIGHRFSNMDIVMKGSVYFTRDVLWGGTYLTSRIRDAMRVNLSEAEKLKEAPSKKREEAIGIIAPLLEKFVSEIRMSFDYFESQFGKNVEKLYISGGTSYLSNMVDFLKENLGVDVVMWNPFEGIEVSEFIMDRGFEKTPSLFVVAVGLALRE